MDKNANPLDYLIICCEQELIPTSFDINNAKDELLKLRQENYDLKKIFEHPVAYGTTNDRLDLYNLRITNNIYNDQTKIVPLYSNKKEFLSGDWKGYDPYGKLSK